jgi:hypothetical protein
MMAAAPFVLGSVIKIVYDMALYLNFKGIKPQDEQEKSEK